MPKETSSTQTRTTTIPAMIPTGKPAQMYSCDNHVTGEYSGLATSVHAHTCIVRLPLSVGATVDVGIAVVDEVIVCIDAVDKMAVHVVE